MLRRFATEIANIKYRSASFCVNAKSGMWAAWLRRFRKLIIKLDSSWLRFAVVAMWCTCSKDLSSWKFEEEVPVGSAAVSTNIHASKIAARGEIAEILFNCSNFGSSSELFVWFALFCGNCFASDSTSTRACAKETLVPATVSEFSLFNRISICGRRRYASHRTTIGHAIPVNSVVISLNISKAFPK